MGFEMPVKDILLPLTSFPVPTEAQTIKHAVELALTLQSSVSALAYEMDIQSPIGLYADPLHVSGILAADSKKSAANARDLLSSFEVIAIGKGVAHDHSLVRRKPVEISQHLVEEARLHDLTILPLRETDTATHDIAEHLIFEFGRPLLILPDHAKREIRASLDNVAIAWDASRPAARALADALPLIQQGRQVRIFTVVDEKPIKPTAAAPALAKHLARHNVNATIDEVKSNGRPIGTVFDTYVSEHKIDLLVMGAYGHSRMREFILGGATKSMLTRPATAVLMSH